MSISPQDVMMHSLLSLVIFRCSVCFSSRVHREKWTSFLSPKNLPLSWKSMKYILSTSSCELFNFSFTLSSLHSFSLLLVHKGHNINIPMLQFKLCSQITNRRRWWWATHELWSHEDHNEWTKSILSPNRKIQKNVKQEESRDYDHGIQKMWG